MLTSSLRLSSLQTPRRVNNSMNALRAVLLTGLFSIGFSAPSGAATLPGFWTEESLESYAEILWPGMNAVDVGHAVEAMPDRIGSRALNQLAKSLILAPAPVTDDADGATMDTVTAQRLRKLLAMGALDEAKRLEGIRSNDDAPPTASLVDTNILVLLANNEKEGACLDLLAYKSESPDSYAALSEQTHTLDDYCLADSAAPANVKGFPLLTRAESQPIVVPLRAFDGLSDAEAALIAYHPNVTLGEETPEQAASLFPKMSPLKQALVLHSPRAQTAILFRLLPYGLRHDLISLDDAKAIFDRAAISGKAIPAIEARIQAKDLTGYQRLPLYHKTLASYGKGDTPPLGDLATDILAAGLTSNLYALLPFTFYLDNLDLGTQTPRSAFAAALVLGLNGQSTMGSKGNVTPDESHWILSAILRDVPYSDMAFSAWHEKHARALGGLSKSLQDRLFLMLRTIAGEDADKNPILSHYDNKKWLTGVDNYVMHEDEALKKAESLAKDNDIGGMIIAVMQANNNNAPDRLNPAEMVELVGLLNDTALTRTARKLAMESLVFKMEATPGTTEGEPK